MADILSIVHESEPLDGGLTELHAVLPIQFYGSRRGTSEVEPLRHLMVAMLADAVRCFQTKFDRRQPGKRQEFAEVRSWIFFDEDDGPFSFRVVCDELQIDPEALRKRLTCWAAKKLAGQKPCMIRRLALPAKRISA
jgi:hypothetical protein